MLFVDQIVPEDVTNISTIMDMLYEVEEEEEEEEEMLKSKVAEQLFTPHPRFPCLSETVSSLLLLSNWDWVVIKPSYGKQMVPFDQIKLLSLNIKSNILHTENQQVNWSKIWQCSELANAKQQCLGMQRSLNTF